MSELAMRVNQLLIWILLKQMMASGEILYIRGFQEQTVDISCESKPENTQLTSFHLYRKSDQRKDLLLSVNQTEKNVHWPEYRTRIRVSGRLNSSRVNITLLDLRREDTGLYVCEFTTADKTHKPLNPTEVILIVKGDLDVDSTTHLSDQTPPVTIITIHCTVHDSDGNCSCVSHSSVIYVITAAVVLLLFTLSCLLAAHYRKAHPKPMTVVPIYEQMTTGSPAHRSLDNHLTQTQPSAKDPVYALPQKLDRAESPYAVPRKVKAVCEAPPRDSSRELVVEIN